LRGKIMKLSQISKKMPRFLLESLFIFWCKLIAIFKYPNKVPDANLKFLNKTLAKGHFG
jgi:hypothetical protein